MSEGTPRSVIEKHSLFGGRVHVYKRADADKNWQCSAYLKGRNFRASTREDNLSVAKAFAEDWYLTLRGKIRTGVSPAELEQSAALTRRRTKGIKFKDAAKEFEREYQILTAGERSEVYTQMHSHRIRAHLTPFFGEMFVDEITSSQGRDYRVHRMTSKKDPKTGEPLKPARSTMHQEFVTLRQILKMCRGKGWIEQLPDLSNPYRGSGKISHRAWFSKDEYKQLYKATGARAKEPRHPRWIAQTETLHDLVLFMANTGLRPDEAKRLEFRDVAIVLDEETNQRILEIEVRGKRGLGFCKSMPGAIQPFIRLQKRTGGSGATKLFEPWPSQLFKNVLKEENMHRDRDGQLRSLYSLRHSYICFRLMEGADIYQVAKNCRTSVEMIEKHYAAHLKNTLDASAINVRKSKKKRAKAPNSSEKSVEAVG